MPHNEFLFADEDDPDPNTGTAAAAAAREKTRSRQEKAWSRDYPAEWAEWVRLQPLLDPFHDVLADRRFDFELFLMEVGRSPSSEHRVRRRDQSLPYRRGNLHWAAARSEFLDYRQVEQEFGLRKTALYDLRRRNLVEVVEVPGSGFRFPRRDLERLYQAYTIAATSKQSPAPTPPPTPAKPRRASRKPNTHQFRFLK